MELTDDRDRTTPAATEHVTGVPAPIAGPRTRRAILGGALGGLGLAVANAIQRTTPVAAANGDTVHVGDQALTGTQTTIISSGTESISVLWGNSTAAGGTGVGLRGDAASQGGSGVWGNGAGTGVSGTSGFGTGVRGTTNSGIGVHGSSGPATAVVGSAGVVGNSNDGLGVWGVSSSNTAVYGTSTTGTGVSGIATGSQTVGVQGVSNGVNGNGVRGEAAAGRGVVGLSTSGRGVHGESGSGWGVYGRSDASHGVHGVAPAASGTGVFGESSAGTGVHGTSTTGFALRTSGRLKVEKVSGVATIRAGKATVTVAPGVDLTAGSFLLLTPRANIGTRALWFTVDAATNRFTIRLSSARPSATPVAWLLLG